MSPDKPKTAMNVVPLVLLTIAALAAVVYLVAYHEDRESGISEEQAQDARQVEQVLENAPTADQP